MIGLDSMIKSILSKIPVSNSDSLKLFIMNTSILSRLDDVSRTHGSDESYMIESMKSLPSDNLHQIMKVLKIQNTILTNSDSQLTNLFDELSD